VVASLDSDKKRTRLAPATSTESPPAASSAKEAEDLALSERFELLLTKDYPPDRPAWPKFIWDSLFPDLPRQDGVYFAVPIRDEWTPLVSPDVVERANTTIQAPARIEVREAVGQSRPRLLAVVLFDSAEPTNSRHLSALLLAWNKVQQWHRDMVGGVDCRPLDEFIATRIRRQMIREINAVRRDF
jgi:hypothetical protein